MANLLIKTKVNNVYVVGDFCNWSLDGGLTGVRKDKHNLIKLKICPKANIAFCAARAIGVEKSILQMADKCPTAILMAKRTKKFIVIFRR